MLTLKRGKQEWKYQDLRLEVQKIWNVNAKVVPLVGGALGAITNNLESYLGHILGNHEVRPLVKKTLLGSANILRQGPVSTPRSEEQEKGCDRPTDWL